VTAGRLVKKWRHGDFDCPIDQELHHLIDQFASESELPAAPAISIPFFCFSLAQEAPVDPICWHASLRSRECDFRPHTARDTCVIQVLKLFVTCFLSDISLSIFKDENCHLISALNRSPYRDSQHHAASCMVDRSAT